MPPKLGENARSKTIRRYLGRCERAPQCDRPGRRPDPVFLLPDSRRETIASPDALHGSPLCDVPRIGHNSIPADRGRSPLHLRSPANSQVRTARFSGLVNTFAKVKSRNRRPKLCALSSPRSVRGKSVRPVCWPERLHAVSPCLARQTIGRTPLMVSSLQPRPPGTSVGKNRTRNTSWLSHLYRSAATWPRTTLSPIAAKGQKRNAASSARQRPALWCCDISPMSGIPSETLTYSTMQSEGRLQLETY